MNFQSTDLIEDLISRTKEVLNQAIELQQIGEEQLNWKPEASSWSILECIEHLNRYGDFYLPEIKERIQNSNTKPATAFKSGLLGNYFAKSMLPKEKLNKMKTFKSMNPVGSDLDVSLVDKFINQQRGLLDLLNKSRTVDLQKTKTSISISSWIKLRLGDTFRVVIYHNQRHMVQAGKLRRFNVD